MKIFIQIFYSALRDSTKFKKNLVAFPKFSHSLEIILLGGEKCFLSESDEVTKSDVCQEILQRWDYECSLSAAAYINNRFEEETL